MKQFLELIRDTGDSCMSMATFLCVGFFIGLFVCVRCEGRKEAELEQKLTEQKCHYDSLLEQSEYRFDTLKESRTTYTHTPNYKTGYIRGYIDGYDDGRYCCDEGYSSIYELDEDE